MTLSRSNEGSWFCPLTECVIREQTGDNRNVKVDSQFILKYECKFKKKYYAELFVIEGECRVPNLMSLISLDPKFVTLVVFLLFNLKQLMDPRKYNGIAQIQGC